MKLQLPARPVKPSPTRPTQPAKPKKPSQPNKVLAGVRRRLTSPAPAWVRPALMAGVLLAVLVAVVVPWLSLMGGVDLRMLEQHRSDNDTAARDVSSVAQSFRSPRANLSLIEVELGTYAGLQTDGRIRLLAGDGLGGSPVYEAPITTADFRKNPYLAVRFPPIASSEGATYTLVLETPGRPLKSAIGARYNSYDALSSGSLYLDGEAARGDIAMVAYYRYDLGTLLADIARALTGNALLIVSWLALLLLPGIALLLWVPNNLSGQQRALAAPALSLLALPVFMLITRALNLRLNTLFMWVLLAVCAAAIAARWLRTRSRRPASGVATTVKPAALLRTEDAAFWGLLVGVLVLTVASRLVSLREAVAGMGLDAYHHTLISRMFAEQGGIPANYLPYADLASFTYHYGFHALAASVGWLAGRTTPDNMLVLMPQAGQIATALPVLTLTLFAWRLLNDRWAGLAAGALAGLVSVFPAFYVNWSRYTQGLGLALLPVAWVLLVEALRWSAPPLPTADQRLTVRDASRQSGPFMLAVIGAAGLALTHYRIAMIYAVFAALYLLWSVLRAVRARGSRAEALREVWRTLLVAALTLAALSPWLVNLYQNFGSRFVGRDSPVAQGYYSLQNMIGDPLLNHPSLPILLALSFGGLVWAVKRRDVLPLLPALTWIILGVWSNPYLLPVRLPYSGYLDATTLATGAWLPLSAAAGFTVSRFAAWALSLGDSYAGWRQRLWRAAAAGALSLVALVGGLAAALPTAAMLDSKPYLSQADYEALVWMRDNVPPSSFVLANPFAFLWDAPPQAIQGSDAGLWAPLLAGVRATVPPIPAYNERLSDPRYLDNIRDIIQHEPFEGQRADWEALRSAGVTHIYAGSRGGALSVPGLLASDEVDLVFHRDAVWVFALR